MPRSSEAIERSLIKLIADNLKFCHWKGGFRIFIKVERIFLKERFIVYACQADSCI